MVVEYENTLEDVLNFNKYHSENSLTYKRKILLYRIIFPVLWFIILYNTIVTNPNGGFVLFALIAIPWIIFIPALFKFSIKRTTKKMVSEGKNKNILTKHILELTPSEVIEKTENSMYSTKWVTVERVVHNNDFIFIYVNALSAHLIPSRAFKREDDFISFYNTALGYKNSSV